jgi:hypothetical protein
MRFPDVERGDREKQRRHEGRRAVEQMDADSIRDAYGRDSGSRTQGARDEK